MNQEKLLSTLLLCANETQTAACAGECPLYKGDGDCVSKLLRAAREEIVFLQALVCAHEEIEELLRAQIRRLREASK